MHTLSTLSQSFLVVIILLLLCVSCQSIDSPPPLTNWQLIAGREDNVSTERPLLYRASVPLHWLRQDPPDSTSLIDTTKSVCEFYIQEGNQKIRLTIHTFPFTQTLTRIPPQAQIARWKKQFEELDPLTTHVHLDSHGGFSGLYFEGEGLIQNQPTQVIGWSMQLASSYERQLSLEKYPFDRYKRADYTIKASGPPSFMKQHRSALIAFARSFELIDELSSPL